ncbi:MAG: DNA primase [Alphaproteobacteria bacterium]
MITHTQYLDIDAAHAVPLSEVVLRYGVKTVRQGREVKALCPFHDERTPSFTVNEDKGFYHCFGCGAHGDVIDFVQAIEGVDFKSAIERLTSGVSNPQAVQRYVEARAEAGLLQTAEGTRNRKQACAYWKASRDPAQTVVQKYLCSSRAITLGIPRSIRCHQNLKHYPTGLEFPAMIAAMQGPDGNFVGVHRTYLLPDGRGKARVSDPKLALGSCPGKAVRLAAATDTLGIAEGIETALSAMQMYGDPVWCACGSNLAGVIIPDTVTRVVIYVDNGVAGEQAAEKAAAAFHVQGRRVTKVRPIDGYGDFNDYLQAQAESEAA